MAGTFGVALLSGAGAGGLPIPVAQTITPGTLIHTAVAGTDSFDVVELFASNITATAATITIEWGGVTDPGNHLVKAYSIPANSPPIPVAPGLRVNGGVIIRAFSGTASAINITGNVITIRP